MSNWNAMKTSDLLKGSGLGAIALAVAAMVLPGQAAAQERSVRLHLGGPAQETAQASNSQGEARPNRSPERRADRVENQGQWRAQRIEQRSNNAARQVENRGDWRANRVENRSEQRADRIPNGGGWQHNRTQDGGAETWRSQNGGTWQSRRDGGWRSQNGEGPRDANRDRTTQERTWRDRNSGGADSWRNRDSNNWRDSSRTYRDTSRWRDNDRNSHRWDRRWRDNNRYDWHRYRESNRNHYRIGRYYAPYYGYSYRRLGIGFSLGSMFYSDRYWINNPWQYRLPEVYGPYRWVRYYDDVLLVDIYTGEVVDVIYDFFW